MGPDADTKWKVLLTVAIQLTMAYQLREASFGVLLFFTYVVSGTLNHMMTLAGHELSHNLGFKGRLANRLLAIVSNIPMGVPSAVSFKRYHMEHHRYQGEDVVDVDIPSDVEVWLFSSRPGKVLWMFLQPFFYALRPLVINPKMPGKWEHINLAVVAATNFMVYQMAGWQGLFYLIAGSLLGMGIHPVAGHFVAEHYVLNVGYETMSYLGPLNWLCFNVGFHNEHHDFPNIPGSRLHLVRELAPEYYEPMPTYHSWSKVIWDFCTRKDMSPASRVKRVQMSQEAKAELHERENRAHQAS